MVKVPIYLWQNANKSTAKASVNVSQLSIVCAASLPRNNTELLQLDAFALLQPRAFCMQKRSNVVPISDQRIVKEMGF